MDRKDRQGTACVCIVGKKHTPKKHHGYEYHIYQTKYW